MTVETTEVSNSADSANGSYKTIPDLLQDSGVTHVSSNPGSPVSLHASTSRYLTPVTL